MKHLRSLQLGLLLLAASVATAADLSKDIPEPLKAWQKWATWDDRISDCPRPFNDAEKHFCVWPSRLELTVERTGGRFAFEITVFAESWVALPGSAEAWPLEVRTGETLRAVVEHDGTPAVQLEPGTFRVEGVWHWSELPQRLPLPREAGVLLLNLDGKPVELPAWDAQGFLWLKRDGSVEEADKNFLSTKIYSALEDGNPLWLRTEVELTVSGKSREEEIGAVLPDGWKLASVESQIPTSIDDTSRLKVQVRAGKWTIHADAFRFDNPKELRYAAGAKPASGEQLLAFRSKPDFRVVEIGGAPSVDISQTTFPEKWRGLPVYRWDTASALRIEERMRGMGEQKPAGLTIARELWLDENGRNLTFRDFIGGQMQEIWRLDVAAGQDLGSVRSDGQGQLITRNPQTAAPGVEIRARNLNLEATGRMPRAREFSATGWRADADSVKVTLQLPPGWRLFALFGADWVKGDWLTSWTLLDLFLLLIFSLAVFRLWGLAPAVLAFLAFGLSYHEVGAPRYAWLVLLVPLALQRVVPEGRGRRLVAWGKGIAVAILLLVAVPFVAAQVRQALYPQLEGIGEWEFGTLALSSDFEAAAAGGVSGEVSATDAVRVRGGSWGYSSAGISKREESPNDNLQYDAKARIQTGPGVPEWNWRTVSFGWNGPVQASQHVHPLLIPLPIERALTALRVILLLTLAAVLLGVRRLGGRRSQFAVILLLACLSSTAAQAQLPDQATLDALRARLLETSDAFPHAAEIPSVTLTLKERRIVVEAEIHAATRTAVPLPGRLPAWSPLKVVVDGKPEAALRREDGYLWVVLAAGVHRVHIEAMLTAATEWEWTYLLKPRQVKVEAPDWTFTGVRPDGVPDQQVFFALKQKAAPGAATYDRQDLQTVTVVDRYLELGLIWQVRTTVTRLSPPGKATALRIPLLPGENILSSNAELRDGAIDVRLGAQETSFTWESGLAVTPALKLATRADDTWVERWHLVASPVWNVTFSGLAPIFDTSKPELIPVWQPWPGESVALTMSRPEAIAGATVTVSKATHAITLGKRQRLSKLDLSLRCSLGEDFLVELPAAAEITALTQDGKAIPVRKDGAKLIIPVHPGEQVVSIAWKINAPLGLRATAEEVRLPVESANITSTIQVPENRWVLWAAGPLRGPAVLFWGILVCALLAAVVLGKMPLSPLRTVEWMLLVIGLTQVPLVAALVVVSWLFLLAARGRDSFQRLESGSYNLLQVFLVALTLVALIILLFAVGEGLLGNPEMFIRGNGSYRTLLRWFQPRSVALLPTPACVSISIWWYRFLMLLWALWLAAALIRWLRMGWQNFSSGGYFQKNAPPTPSPEPPPLPVTP